MMRLVRCLALALGAIFGFAAVTGCGEKTPSNQGQGTQKTVWKCG